MKNKTLIILLSIFLTIGVIVSVFLVINKKNTKEPENKDNTAITREDNSNNTITPIDAPITSGTAVLASNLDVPWQIAELPDGRILFTERSGRVRLIEDKVLKLDNIINLESVVSKQGEGGLLGIAVDPDYANTKFIYIYYTYIDSKKELLNRLVRYKETEKNVFIEDKILMNAIPGGINHNGGIIEFGPEGKLYVGVGERYVPEVAQNLNDLGGKILRLNNDGTIPSDNPFPNSYIWSYGHRNPQGFAWNKNGIMYSTEHGPSGGQGCCQDEINKIEKGKNYGWPVIRGDEKRDGMVSPLRISGNNVTWAPGDIEFTKDESLIFTGLRGAALYKVIFEDGSTDKIKNIEELYQEEYGRLRAVKQLSNGDIVVSTSNKDGRGRPKEYDDKIIIIKP